MINLYKSDMLHYLFEFPPHKKFWCSWIEKHVKFIKVFLLVPYLVIYICVRKSDREFKWTSQQYEPNSFSKSKIMFIHIEENSTRTERETIKIKSNDPMLKHKHYKNEFTICLKHLFYAINNFQHWAYLEKKNAD